MAQVLYFRCAGEVSKFRIHSKTSSVYPIDCSDTSWKYCGYFANSYTDCYVDTVTKSDSSGDVIVREYDSSTATTPSNTWNLADDNYISTKTSPRFIEIYAAPVYTVTTSVPGGNGTISGNSGSYTAGSTCTLTASPSSGYRLKNWTYNGRSVGSTNPYSFTVNGNTSITAVFEKIPIETLDHYFRLLNGGGVSAFTVYYYNSNGTYATTNIRSTDTTTITADKSKSIKVGNISYSSNYHSPWKIYYNLENQAWRTDNVVSVSETEKTFSDTSYSRYIQIGATRNNQYELRFDVSGVTTLYGYEGDTVNMPSASKEDSSPYTKKYGEYYVYLNATDESVTTLTANVYHSYYESYTFYRWTVDGQTYKRGDVYTFPAADKTATSIWTTVTHDAGWSSTSRVQLTTPTLSGYTFLGWYTAASGGTYVGKGGDYFTPEANTELYAHWSVNPGPGPTPGQKISEFAWAKTPATGVKVSECITAAKWIEVQNDLNTIRQQNGYSNYAFTSVATGDRITADIVKEVINCMFAAPFTANYRKWGGKDYDLLEASYITSGGTIKATMFWGNYQSASGIRRQSIGSTLNSLISWYNSTL